MAATGSPMGTVTEPAAPGAVAAVVPPAAPPALGPSVSWIRHGTEREIRGLQQAGVRRRILCGSCLCGPSVESGIHVCIHTLTRAASCSC